MNLELGCWDWTRAERGEEGEAVMGEGEAVIGEGGEGGLVRL